MGDFFVGFQSSKFCNVAVTFFYLILAKQKDPKHITLVGELLHRSSKRQAQTTFVKMDWALHSLALLGHSNSLLSKALFLQGPYRVDEGCTQPCGAGSTNTGRVPGGTTSPSEPPLTL